VNPAGNVEKPFTRHTCLIKTPAGLPYTWFRLRGMGNVWHCERKGFCSTIDS